MKAKYPVVLVWFVYLFTASIVAAKDRNQREGDVYLSFQGTDPNRPSFEELPGLYLSPDGKDTLILRIDSQGHQIYYRAEYDSGVVVRKSAEWEYATEPESYDVDMPEGYGELNLKEWYPTGYVTGLYRTRSYWIGKDKNGNVFTCFDIHKIEIEFVKVK